MSAKRSIDARFMRLAIALAGRGQGNVAPNPAVGCVIVRDGIVVGRGWTAAGGRPHAETEALGRAVDRARGADVYVSLEPCAHHGHTPPCAEALIRAGVSRVVVGASDPDPRVNGAGIRLLQAAGIEVETGLCTAEATRSLRPYLVRQQLKRPFVTVKTATTLDGRIATVSGMSRWITGREARAAVHGLRARNDAILVGGRTAIADDPLLTCRLPGMAHLSPVRVVLAGREPLAATLAVISTAARVPTWLVLTRDAWTASRAGYRDAGVTIIEVDPDDDGRPDPGAALRALADRGLTSLLIEGGGRTIAAFIRRRLVDRIVWFREPMVIGGDGVPAFAGLGVCDLGEAPRFERVSARPAGTSMIESYEAIDEETECSPVSSQISGG